MKTDIKIFKDKLSMAAYASDWLTELANQYISRLGRFNVALSGGSTPKILYENLLLSEEIKWGYIDFFWSDERYVPFGHPESNCGSAYRQLLKPLGIEEEHYFPVPTTYPAAHQGAMEYEETIRHYFSLPDRAPSFDLIFLGLGSDGHTASLFPDTKALLEARRLVTANWVEKLQNWRITFTYPLINNAQNIAFLVSGRDKAEAVRDVLKQQDMRHPAARVQPQSGKLFWMLDADAAAFL